jgi:hypothetical protein
MNMCKIPTKKHIIRPAAVVVQIAFCAKECGVDGHGLAMGRKMQIQIKESGRACVVSVSGKLDALSAGDYEKALNQLIADGKIRFVVDF